MTKAPSMRRAGALYGASFAMMVVISLVFYAFKGTLGRINIPWLSVAISLFAVVTPAAIACYWPKNGAPGELPSFNAVNPWVLAGAGFFSLPLYVLFATLQINITKLLPFHIDAGLVEPLTATGPLSFAWICLAIAILPAVTEEFLYRGVLQQAAVRRFGPALGIVLTACFFSLAHMELAGAVSRILMGLWFGYLFWSCNSLRPGALAHAFNNTWGVVLASCHMIIEPNLPWVYLIAGASLFAGYACFDVGNFWPWSINSASEPVKSSEPQLPHFVTMARPDAPPKD